MYQKYEKRGKEKRHSEKEIERVWKKIIKENKGSYREK